jgi:phosphoglycerate dehydrogenase-like enzyme
MLVITKLRKLLWEKLTLMKPVPQGSPYPKHPRILVTPHNTLNTENANRKSYDLAIPKVKAFLEEKPQNVVA